MCANTTAREHPSHTPQQTRRRVGSPLRHALRRVLASDWLAGVSWQTVSTCQTRKNKYEQVRTNSRCTACFAPLIKQVTAGSYLCFSIFLKACSTQNKGCYFCRSICSHVLPMSACISSRCPSFLPQSNQCVTCDFMH